MNAYELADELDKINDIPIETIINMLRQQADRIAELEKDLAKYDELAIDDLEGKRIIWCACGDGITPDSGAVCGVCASFRSTKEQSAEPVAWTNQKWLDGIAKEPQLFQPLFVHGKQTEHNTIPLYTTPQIKELSDRELVVFLMDEIDRASEWLVDGETHMAIGVLGQCHAKIRKHLSNTKESE